jgi:hypothetical protein
MTKEEVLSELALAMARRKAELQGVGQPLIEIFPSQIFVSREADDLRVFVTMETVIELVKDMMPSASSRDSDA